jgi:hypothetical protein
MSKRGWIMIGLVLSAAVPARSTLAQSVGHASRAALTSALAKQNAMREEKGPDSVTLSADEMASLVESNLDRGARKALASIRIRLDPGRLALQALLVTSELGTEYLGPLAYLLSPLEPLFVSGPARATKAGLITWQPDTLVIRSFDFPQGAIPRLVNRLTGTADGSIPIAVPPTVRRIRIMSTGVTFSRRTG